MHQRPWVLLRRVLAGTWLLGGLTVLIAGLAELVAAGDKAVLLRMHPEPGPTCAVGPFGMVVGPSGCTSTPVAIHTEMRTGLTLVIIAGLALAAFRYAHQRGDAPRILPRFFPAVAASVFSGVTLVLLLSAPDSSWYRDHFPLDDGPGFRLSFLGACLYGLTALATAIWGVRQAISARNRPLGPVADPAPR